MAIEKRTRGEEILIRLNEQGIAGASYKTITEVVEDGTVISATEGGLIELAVVGDADGSLAKLLGEVTHTALVQVEQYRAETAAAEEKVAANVRLLEQAAVELHDLREQNLVLQNLLASAGSKDQAEAPLATSNESSSNSEL